MEDLPHEVLAILVVLMMVAVPCFILLIWKARKRYAERRAAEAMRRGNKLYGEWRSSAGRREMD